MTSASDTEAVRPSILVAEDNSDSRGALRALLEAYGFDVIEAENGEEAVRKALEARPDLVLMDIMMPEMDGLEATKRLRAMPEVESIPILALTAMAGSRNPALDAGCDDYLTKPVDIPVFLETIRSWLSGGTRSTNGQGA